MTALDRRLFIPLLAIPALISAEAPPGALASIPTALADEWELVGEAVDEPGWDIWCSSPVMDDRGQVHLFCSRWKNHHKWEPGWRIECEIARYVAPRPEGPFHYAGTVLKGDGKGWDAVGLHNPHIRRIGDEYVLTYIANDGVGGLAKHGPNQRIGMVSSRSLEGPWKPVNGDPERPLLSPPDDPAIWCHASGCGVNNPSLLPMPDGTFRLYFKARRGPKGALSMGVALSNKLAGPWTIRPEPITANERGIEDGNAFLWRGHVCLVTTDNHGILEEGGGLLWVSKDGLQFDPRPLPAFHHFGRHYFPQGVPKEARVRYSRNVKFERPQILLENGEPAWLYVPSGVAIDGSDGSNSYVLRRKAKRGG